MHRKWWFMLVLASVVMLALTACGGEKGPASAPSNTGKAVFAVSDDAADMGAVSSVQLTIDSARVHAEGGTWTSVSSKAQVFDLLELKAKGVAQLLAEAELKAGTYDQMELSISKVVVVDGDGQHEAKLPSSKLQLKGDLEVTADATATANFDFIADQSLHVTGEGRFILAPVVKVETRADAKVQIQTNGEVRISGGKTTTDVQVGMDFEGNVDDGLRITADAVLTIAASGKILQTKGQALAVGTIKAVDSANGTVTITTKGGTDLTLHLASDTAIKVKGSSATLATLTANIGAEVITKYNAETKAMADISASADSKARAEISGKLDLSGTIKSVDTVAGTITVTADSGAEVVLKVGSDSKLFLGGSNSNLLGLGAKLGSRVEGEYGASAGTVGVLQAEAEPRVTVNGTLKAVDAVEGTITVTGQSGADVVLDIAYGSKVLVNGSLATLATLKTIAGSEVTVEYSQQSKVVGELNARLQVDELSATVTGVIKAVNPSEGTVTITTAGGKDVVLDVTANSSIVADGSIASLVNLATKIGASVTAEYNAKTATVTSINTQAQANVTATGTLKSVDQASNTVTITSQAGADVVLNISSDTQILIGSSGSTLASLAAQVGAQATVEYNAQTRAAAVINAQAEASAKATVNGTLKSVDVLAGTITITTQGSKDVVLGLNANSNVLIAGKVSTFLSLAANIGAQATAEYNATTNAVTSINAQGKAQGSASASVSGTVKKVDILAGTVTITAQGGGDVVLDLTAQSNVLINGSTATVAFLATKVGSQATVEYNAETKAVVTLNAK